jgi:hypothetical protein
MNLQAEIRYTSTQTEEDISLLGKQVAQFVLGKQGYNSFSLDDDFNYQSFNIDGILYIPVHHPSFILVYRRKFIGKY